ncbi:hypothetical protein FRB95_003781 [Tulasnella sp. JGI-2019a]|nr:hypothetical protein FRB95_003781 [Tulasnella sp. JGI-2019a]
MPPATMMRMLPPYFVRNQLPVVTLSTHNIISQQNPIKVAKLIGEAYDTIGDYAIASKFLDDFFLTRFGLALADAVEEANRTSAPDSWYPMLTGIAPDRLRRVPLDPLHDRFGKLDNIVRSQADTWLSVIFSFEPGPLLVKLLMCETWTEAGAAAEYDALWMAVDTLAWSASKYLGGSPDSLSELFGLISPEITRWRPMHSFEMFKEKMWYKHAKELAHGDPPSAQPYVSSIPMATPQDMTAKAPERLASGESKSKPKAKKSRAQSRKKHGAGAIKEPTEDAELVE